MFNLPSKLFMLYAYGILLVCMALHQSTLAQSLPSCTENIMHADDNDGVAAAMDIDKDNDGLIEICDLEGLNEIRYQLDGTGYKTSANTTKTTAGCATGGCQGYELVRDLDFSNNASYRDSATNKNSWTTNPGWLPIGNSENAFKTTFAGNGHAISKLHIRRSACNIGLFGVAEVGSKIKDIKLVVRSISRSPGNLGESNCWYGSLVGDFGGDEIINAHVTTDANRSVIAASVISSLNKIGGLVGLNREGSAIRNSSVNNNKTSFQIQLVGIVNHQQVGGLVSVNKGSIFDSHAVVAILNDGLTNVVTSAKGGLVGVNEGTISNSYSRGEDGHRGDGGIYGDQNARGGLVGRNAGTIFNSYSTMAVYNNGINKGGLVGHNNGKIFNSYYAGSETGGLRANGGNRHGGLVGLNGILGEIYNSYASGSMQGGSESGGLVGRNVGIIENSYALGKVTGRGSFLGGLVGYMANGEVKNSYAISSVAIASGTSNEIGGLVGSIDADNNPAITASYWDIDISGLETSFGGTSKTTAELQRPTVSGTTVTDVYYNWSTADWDFGDESNYPALRYGGRDNGACDSLPETMLPHCGALLSRQFNYENGLSALFIHLNGTEVFGTAQFSTFRTDYKVTIPFPITLLRLIPLAINPEAVITISKYGDDPIINYFDGKTTSTEISLTSRERQTTLTVVVEDPASEAEQAPISTTYTLSITRDFSHDPISFNIESTDSADEGRTVTLSVDSISGGSGQYRYKWSHDAGEGVQPLSETNTSASYAVLISESFVSGGANVTTRNIVFTLEVDDSFSTAPRKKTITINKVDNGRPTIELEAGSSMWRVSSNIDVVPDPDGSGEFNYQWQSRTKDTGWNNILGATAADYPVPQAPGLLGDSRYRVIVRYTDGQGYKAVEYLSESKETPFPSEALRSDIDDDDDGLIDIYYLEDLNAMRHSLDGSGYKTSASATKSTRGCRLVSGEETCNGYELRRALDFDNDASYWDAAMNKTEWTVDDFEDASDLGWQPIGSITENNCNNQDSACFASTFNGNGYAISNLQINRIENNLGLFKSLARDSEVHNLGLLKVDINAGTGTNISGIVGVNFGAIAGSYTKGIINGRQNIGGLVGRNYGIIMNSNATVAIAATSNQGGLVGINQGVIINSYAQGSVVNTRAGPRAGGLVGNNYPAGRIINSYAASKVEITLSSGRNNVIGGLVAQNDGTIENSYARGNVTGLNRVGSLIGLSSGTVKNSYAIGKVTGTDKGGLIGGGSGTITASYWNSETSGLMTSAGGTSKTTTELQEPTMPGTTSTEVYYNWSIADWDFGDESNYPALRYAAVDDVEACTREPNAALPRCGDLLPDQTGDGYAYGRGLSNLYFRLEGDSSDNDEAFNPPFSSLLFDYSLAASTAKEIRLRPIAAAPNFATILITKIGERENTNYFAGRRSGQLSKKIMLEIGQTVLNILVTENDISTTYAISITRVEEDISFDIDAVNSANEGETITLKAINVRGGNEIYEYAWQYDAETQVPLEDITGSITSSSLVALMPANWIPRETTTQSVEFTLTINSGSKEPAAMSKAITITKINNGPSSVEIELETTTSTLSVVATASDPDGDGGFSYQWQKRSRNNPIWTNTTTARIYRMAEEDRGDVRYRLQVLEYTDGQGYKTDYSKGEFKAPFALEPLRTDIDDDDDGLIDIYYLEDLNAMRYRLDGSGFVASAETSKTTVGCLKGDEAEECYGYELRSALDFNDDGSYLDIANKAFWTTGEGWQPIGDFVNSFDSRFVANAANDDGLTLSNLMINRTGDFLALFGVTANRSRIMGIRLLGVNVKGRFGVGGLVGSNYGLIANSSVAGLIEGSDSWIGGLAGTNYGSIINSYVGSADGNVMQTRVVGKVTVGGLVGYSIGPISNSHALAHVEGRSFGGGLVGYNQGPINNSYAVGSVSSAFYGGGLVGYNDSYVGANSGGRISNVYASGDVVGSIYPGGLVGYNDSVITNGYAVGNISGSGGLGGLVGINDSEGSVISSYWDSETSGVGISAGGGTSKTTVELRSSTATATIYTAWSENDWVFGSADEQKYPTLKYAEGTDAQGYTLCGREVLLPDCGTDLPHQETRGGQLLALSGLELSAGVLDPPFDPTKDEYEIVDFPSGEMGTAVTVTATANNASATVAINGTSNMQIVSSLITLAGQGVLNTIGITLTAAGQSTRSYTLRLTRPTAAAPMALAECTANIADTDGDSFMDNDGAGGVMDIDKDGDGLIEICDMAGLNAIRYGMDGSGYKASAAATKMIDGCPQDDGCKGYELVQDLDFSGSDYSNNWRPMGDFADSFNAILNGNGRTISNLRIDRGNSVNGSDYAGLFGHIGADARVIGVGLLNVYIKGRFVVGTLVGWNEGGTIANSYASGSMVSGSSNERAELDSNWIGGLVGINNGLIVNSYAAVDEVMGRTTIGGLVGNALKGSVIMNSYADSDVMARTYVGGLVGFNQGSISNVYAKGSVSGIYYVGGLVGANDNEGTIAYSYADNKIEAVAVFNGLVGSNLSENMDDMNIVGSGGIAGFTREQLQNSNLIGTGWSSESWYFESILPRLKYTAGDDIDNPACEDSPSGKGLPICGALLAEQRFSINIYLNVFLEGLLP